jgi:hypothetical protein
MFGRCGLGRGELYSPVGVAIDTNDIVYVSGLSSFELLFKEFWQSSIAPGVRFVRRSGNLPYKCLNWSED